MTKTITNINTVDIEDSSFGVDSEKYITIASPFSPIQAERVADVLANFDFEKYFKISDNLVLNMYSGLLPKSLTAKEVLILDIVLGENWFEELGYTEPEYEKP